MRLPFRAEEAVALARFAFAFELVALVIAGVLGLVHAVVARADLRETFSLWSFAIFFVVLVYAVLSGPGMFLSRPKFAAVGPSSHARWRRWLAAPPLGTDREFFDLLLYTGLAFLLLLIATAVGQVARLLAR